MLSARRWQRLLHLLPQGTRRTRLLLAALTGAVLCVGIALTVITVHWVQRRAISEAQIRFDNHAARLEDAIRSRFERTLSGFHAVRAYLEASPTPVSRASFRAWVDAHDLKAEYPGVRGIGFIQRVQRDQLDRFIANERADAAPGFNVRSAGQAPDLYVIKYIEPLADNGPAVGYDVGSEYMRRSAATRAVSTGEAALTASIVLVQDGKKRPGFLFYLPVYRVFDGQRPTTPASRDANLQGLVYSPFVLEELMVTVEAAADKLLDFEVFDGLKQTPERLIYDHDQTPVCTPQWTTSAAAPCTTRRYATVRTLSVGGRSLSVAISGTPAFDATVAQSAQTWVALGGATLSGLLAAIVWLLGNGRERAVALAERMTHDLRTATERTEAALRDTDALLSALNMHAIVSVTDAAGRITAVNDEFCRISGYSREELLGRTHHIVASGVHPGAFWQAVWSIISNGTPWRGTVCNRSSNGSLYWVDTFIAPFMGADGKVEKYISIRTDVSASKAARDKLRAQSDHLTAVFALSPDGFVSFDAERRVTLVSPAFERLTGLHTAQVMGLQESAFLALLQGQCTPTTRIETLDSLLPPPGDRRQSERVVIEVARPVTRNLQATLHRSATGRDLQVLHLHDVTHQTEVDRIKSEFLSTAAHELRTPLASIYGFTELLLTRELPPARQKEILGRIHRNSAMVTGILDELLDLARIEARRGSDFQLAHVCLGALAQQAVHDFKPPAERAAPQLTGLEADSWVHADPGKLRQALFNLLSNAYKYSPQGQAVEVSLHTRLRNGTRQHGLRIADHGIGLDPEQLARVGERFYRADKSGSIPGTGLGVSVVKEIIELQGGQLEISSRLGEGTQVSLWLPELARDTRPQADAVAA